MFSASIKWKRVLCSKLLYSLLQCDYIVPTVKCHHQIVFPLVMKKEIFNRKGFIRTTRCENDSFFEEHLIGQKVLIQEL